MNKTKLSTLLIGLLSLTALVGCNPNGETTSSNSGSSSTSNPTSQDSSGPVEVYIKTVTLSKKTASVMLGSTLKLEATYEPANATQKELDWVSTDSSVATVDQTGLVTAKKVGKATISCGPKVVNGSAVVDTCEVTVTDNVILTGVSAKHEFVLFEQNRAKDEKNDDGFYNHTQTYKVGDDNKFNVKPELSVSDAVTFQPVSASRWNHDFTITAKLGSQAVGSEYFSVLDARECDVKFTEAAVGKTFTISVAPGGVDASRVAALTKSITVDVVDGYNVYNAKELGYFDTRPQDSIQDTPIMEDDKDWQCKWEEFKTANNMNANYHPAALIFQKDIAITKDDVPANFFYTAEQAAALNDTKAAGSLVDYTYLYERTIPGDITVDGNYFALDLSAIPLIVRDRCKTTPVGSVVGHSAAFKAIDGGNIEFRNINMTGNARNAINDDDKVLGGGIMFVKGAGSQTLKATNMIATKFFITFFGEKAYIPGNPITKFDLNQVKCFNNYNSFMYNWGSTITASNSLFRSCGGPVIIQDHAGTDTYEADNGMTVDGYAPTTNFVDCTILNYVSGSEAWFQQFNATTVTSDIKMLSDLLYATGLTKSFVTNDKHEGKLYQALATAGQNAFFNFIVLNKSGRAEGITSYPACGTVNITNTDKTNTFNYRQPAYDSVYQAYVAYNTASDADKPAAQQALIAAAVAKGVAFAPDYSDANEKIQAYLTNVCTVHMTLRTLNNMGAPVFDLGEAFPLLAYDGKTEHPYLQDMLSLAAGGSSAFVPSSTQLANIPDYCTLYYGGMALVMELTPYVA